MNRPKEVVVRYIDTLIKQAKRHARSYGCRLDTSTVQFLGQLLRGEIDKDEVVKQNVQILAELKRLVIPASPRHRIRTGSLRDTKNTVARNVRKLIDTACSWSVQNERVGVVVVSATAILLALWVLCPIWPIC
jgi:hypothetical protein